jgi:hypothetical protein
MRTQDPRTRPNRSAHPFPALILGAGALGLVACSDDASGAGGSDGGGAGDAASVSVSVAVTVTAAGSGGADEQQPASSSAGGEGASGTGGGGAGGAGPTEDPVMASIRERIERGRHTFRHDTFGDEAFWGDALRLHEAIAGEANGGVGPGISPAAALELGLKVDQEVIPPHVADAIQSGEVDLQDPATTLTLLSLDAVVGVTGFIDEDGAITSIGIQCALCHSTVDDAFAPGIGRRLDGWPNRDLNVGAIIAASPDLTPVETLLGVDRATVVSVLESWGPGKFDAALLLDGKAFRPDGGSAATLIPAAFGMSGVNLGTYTGWGSTTHWNAFVAVVEMHGQGNFRDDRLNDATRFPIAAANGFADIRVEEDLVTPKLADLHFYQLALDPPAPPPGSFDFEGAARGKVVFEGQARCASCHVPPAFTEPGWNMHGPEEIGIDSFQADRSPEGGYRTTPLRGLHARKTGGFYHDGRFATLEDVVAHYDDVFDLDLDEAQAADLVQYLESL